MAALPFRFTGDERLLADSSGHPDPERAPSPGGPRDQTDVGPGRGTGARLVPRQLTVRALAVGLGIGIVLAAGNVYTGLKSNFIDGGALTAALLSFTFFATFKRFARTPFGPFENNVAQTAAASAGVMVLVHGLMGPMPALMMMGQHYPPWALWLWGVMLAIVGLVIGVLLRRKLVVEDALPFPSGTATAELIKTIHTDQGSASRRTRFLIVAALLAAALTWFRDGTPALIPQAFYLPLTIGGLTAASLTLGVATSPLMAATGIFMGLRGAVSLFLGGVLGWAVVAPIAVRAGWTKGGSYGTIGAWLVWPALGLMMASTLIPVVFAWRTIGQTVRRTLRDARNLSSRTATDGAQPRAGRKDLLVGVGTVLGASSVLAWTGWHAFGFSPLLTCAALLLSVLLAGICARAAGETDIAPIGSFGSLTQILFAGGGPTSSVLSGAIVAGNATEVAQAMWSFKAGENLRASVRAQVIAQILGAIVGSLVVVPVYLLVVRAYPLGSERMPAVVAMSWKATAEAMTGGFAGLPPHGLHAAGIGFALGTLLYVLGRTRAAVFLPSVMALGIGVITPVSLSAAAVLGAGAVVICHRRVPGLAAGETNALSAGLLAGESIVGVLIALLVSAGLLGI